MKFTLATSLLAASSVVAAEGVFFAVHEASSDKQIGVLVDKQEHESGKFFFVDNNPAFYEFDPATGSVSKQDGSQSYKLGTPQVNRRKFLGLLATVGGDGQALVTNGQGKLTNYNFWACTDVDDPKKLSAKNAAILVTDNGNSTSPGSTCKAVNIYKKSVSSPTRPKNGTWTSYTTYCPEPTVVTITSCDSVCVPTAITVSTPTTITCNQCVVPVPTNAVAPKASVSVLPFQTYAGGAGKATMGAAGALAAVAAFFL